MYVIFCLLSTVIQFLSVSPFDVKEAAFTLPRYGRRLLGKEIETKHANSSFFCANECVRYDECWAFNYDETTGTCQLMESNTSLLMDSDDLGETEPDPNFQIVLKKITCKEQPCQYGGNCTDVATPVNDVRGFRCTCPCGRCGGRCERVHWGYLEDACIQNFNAGYKVVESPEECMEFCWDTQGCKSADYVRKRKTCWLNSEDKDTAELDEECYKMFDDISYLFFNCTCKE